MAKRDKKLDFDDGRVIANMNIDGMRCYSPHKRTAFDEFGKMVEQREAVKPTRGERGALAMGGACALIVYGICIFGVLGLVMALYLS